MRAQRLPWVWLDMPPKPKPKEVIVRLTRRLTGACDSSLPTYDLCDELCETLAEEPRLVVIDEAQNLNHDGLSQLRYLHDRPEAQWALVFVGGRNCAKVLSAHPELHSRVARWVAFEPLKGDELLATLRAYHPLLATADAKLLSQIDHRYARGVFRRWARLVQIAEPMAPKRGRRVLDGELAKAALAAVNDKEAST